MRKHALKTKTGKTTHRFVMTEPEYRALNDDSMGLCLGCGAERDSCEPDACKYPCEACGENRVYGVEELLMMGRVEIEEGTHA